MSISALTHKVEKRGGNKIPPYHQQPKHTHKKQKTKTKKKPEICTQI